MTRRAFLQTGLITVPALFLFAERADSHGAQDGRAASAVKAGTREGYTPVETRIHVNQVGYLPHEPKRAVIPAAGKLGQDHFLLVDAESGQPRHRGVLSEYKQAANSKYGHYPNHYLADFDEFHRPGRYQVRLPDGQTSAPFQIGADVYAPLLPLTHQYFTMQQCGAEAAPWHGKCHVDDGVAVGGPRDGQPFDAAGGWHDAGDYLKFVETTSYVTALLLWACDQFPKLMQAGTPGGLPDTLHHARVGLEWLLKMHPTPDEFYYQVGDASDHDSWRLPEDDNPVRNANWKPRKVLFGVGANLAGRTAAALAQASRTYARWDAPFAARCLEKAKTAYALGLKNPQIVTTKPDDYYPEQTWHDDMEWGAIALFQATGERDYLTQAVQWAHLAGAAHETTSVYNTHAIAHSLLYPLTGGDDRARLRGYLRDDANLAQKRAENPYSLATPYIWGTAEAAAGAALTCLLYARVAPPRDRAPYLAVARRQRDFILGVNPFSLSYLIGAGTRYPLYPHHQVANIRKIELSGALVGGPATADIFEKQKISLHSLDTNMATGPTLEADLADEVAVYHDAVQDYVCNEPAMDYTVKFLALAAFYDHEGGTAHPPTRV